MIEYFPKNAEIYSAKEKGKKRVKFGIDPTADRLHLGHLVPLLRVKALMRMGHEIHIILGTATAQYGDPSGRDSMRPILSPQKVFNNSLAIMNQVSQVLNPDHGEANYTVHRNSEWLGPMSMSVFMGLVSKFTVSQLLARDGFQKRIENQHPIGAHELLVPIMQGYDSVHLKADIEIGGTDQLFNFQIARAMQVAAEQEPEVCILCPIINGTDGRKMSKSYDNCIYLDEKADNIYGRVMMISDKTMMEWLPLFTDMTEFNKFTHETTLPPGPMETKKWLARKITAHVYDESSAHNAQSNFERVIQAKEMPVEIPPFKMEQGKTLVDAIVAIRECSKSEAGRLIEQGGVYSNGERMYNNGPLKMGEIIKIGKRHFGRIELVEA